MDLILVADNIRSIENTGALFRLADGVGAVEVVLVGITPYPDLGEVDSRRPWLRQRMTEKLGKTGLSGMGVSFKYFESRVEAIGYLQRLGYQIVCVELTEKSVNYLEVVGKLDEKIAMVVGHEVEGVSAEFVQAAEVCVEIPMYGQGKSLNVAVAAGVVAYALRARHALAK